MEQILSALPAADLIVVAVKDRASSEVCSDAMGGCVTLDRCLSVAVLRCAEQEIRRNQLEVPLVLRYLLNRCVFFLGVNGIYRGVSDEIIGCWSSK